jgi:2-polyprenyl-3-methyl-5-hydroxy-6-metoxy-1,4-benzoquinol methylase
MATVRNPALPSPGFSSRPERACRPELLDTLPPAAREAQQSRRDLRRLNALMGNFAWFERVLADHAAPREPVLELGAGGGELGARLARRHPVLAAVDRAPRPAAWPTSASWHQADLMEFARWADYPVVIGNLIFHHLDDAALRALGQRLDRHARLVIANEPHRDLATHAWFRLACVVIGANAVTRHDGRASIDAGFRDDELPHALGLRSSRWRWNVHPTFRGGYRLVAERKA